VKQFTIVADGTKTDAERLEALLQGANDIKLAFNHGYEDETHGFNAKKKAAQPFTLFENLIVAAAAVAVGVGAWRYYQSRK
jgi:hypothetical protein